MSTNIFAWTEPTPPEGYPAFVSVNRDAEGRHTITVRSRGDGGRNVVTAEMPVEAFESLLTDLAADLYRDEPARGMEAREGRDAQRLDGEAATARSATADAPKKVDAPKNEGASPDAQRLLTASALLGQLDAGYAGHVFNRGGTGDLSDIRTYLDSRAATTGAPAQPEGGHP